MIKIGTAEATDFKLGAIQVAQINVGTGKVWPAGYTYTLEIKSVNYSSAGNTVHATGSDSVEFECYYKKYRYGTLVETTTVVAIPSSTYFENRLDRLYFDYDNYKGTTVAASSAMSATLAYGAAPSITGTFSFAGNTSHNESTITPITLATSSVGASGATITYTGGVVSTKRVWSSGYEENLGTSDVNFSLPAYNSLVPTLAGYVNGYGKEIMIPSLTNNQTGGQSTYTFTSDSYNGTTVQIVITQASNGMHQTSQYVVWDPDNSEAYSPNINVPASPAGYVKFQVRRETSTTYDSGYNAGSTTSTINHSDYTYQAVAYAGGGCITNVGWWDSNYTLQANYSANTSGSMRVSGVIIVANDSSYNLALILNQPAA